MTSHGLNDSLTGAIINSELPQIFRGASEATHEEEVARHRSRHYSRAQATIQDNLDKAVELEREMTSREALVDTSSALLLRDLQTDPDQGLQATEAAARLERDGHNELDSEEEISILKLFLLQFSNFLILLLLGACIASFALGEVVEGVAVIVIVLINATIAVYTEKSASNALAALASMAQPSAVVVRDGERTEVPTRDVVRGDVVVLETGDVVPADCYLLHSIDLKVNEMPLTGEATDVSKNYAAKSSGHEDKLTPPNRIFMSTTVTAGSARALITETGMKTRMGKIASMLAGDGEVKRNCLGVKEQKRTPLQEKLHRLGLMIAVAALTACVGVFVIGVVRGYRDPENPDQPTAVAMVLVAVSLAVSAIPEGLPLCVTICLALGTNNMAKKCNALVRRLPAVETLGSAQVICSDKTGTLTEGKMTALKLWCYSQENGREVDITGRGLLPVGEFLEGDRNLYPQGVDSGNSDTQVGATLYAALLNSTAELKVLTDPRDPATARNLEEDEVLADDFADRALNMTFVSEGNTSEVPIVVAALKAQINKSAAMREHPTVGQRALGKPGPEVPFSSERKMMISVVHTDDGKLGSWTLPHKEKHAALVKGAPNYITALCSTALAPDGSTVAFDDNTRQQIDAAVDELSSQALRVLAVAVKPMTDLPYDPTSADVEVDDKFTALKQDLVFVGLVASMDPERPDVQHAIQVARTAGVRTIMITGDYLQTAIAIAKNIDLVTVNDDPEQVAVDCGVLRPLGPGQYLPDKDMDEITTRCVVFARAKPEDKLQIVQSLQRQGLVAAMTGDGVNDAPALNEADIGVAMGLAGTEVAKGASDLILLDDAFGTIVKAVEKGRQIYSSIGKFITYLLGTNSTQVLVILTCVLLNLPLILGPLSILFLNLAIDGIPSMTMSVEPADDGIMEMQPRPRKQPIITTRMLRKFLGHAIILSAMSLVSFTFGLNWFVGEIFVDDMNDLASRDNPVCVTRQQDGTYVDTPGDDCVAQGLKLARTMGFITMVYADILRGMTARTEMPFYYKPLRNKYLVCAMLFSTLLATCIMTVPGLRDLFGFEGSDLPWWAWLIALSLSFPSLTYDEVLKFFYRRADSQEKENNRLHTSLETIMLEMRQLRHHIVDMETKLHVRDSRPVRRAEAMESARVVASILAKEGLVRGASSCRGGASGSHGTGVAVGSGSGQRSQSVVARRSVSSGRILVDTPVQGGAVGRDSSVPPSDDSRSLLDVRVDTASEAAPPQSRTTE